MGNKTLKRLRRVERAHELYTACLLVHELPQRRTTSLSSYRSNKKEDQFELLFDEEYKNRVGKFYLELCTGINELGTPPGRKARKRFVRGYCAWLRKQVLAHEDR